MNKNKMTIIVWTIVMVSVIIWSIVGILNIRRNQEPYLVSVVVDDSYSDRWLVAKKGMEQAAEDNHIIMNYVYTNQFEGIDSQLEAVKREVDNGADGMLVQWVSSDVDTTQLESMMQDKPMVLLESGIATEGMYEVCSVDNFELGKCAGNQILQDLGDIQDVRIGIFAGNEKLIATFEQLEGVRSVFEEHGISERWVIYHNGLESIDVLATKNLREPVDMMLLLGSEETDIGIDYVVQNEKTNIKLYGVGYSQKSVYYLDKQVLQSLIVPDEFNLGYQAMQVLAKHLEDRSGNSKNSEIRFKAVNCEEIHEKENENLLFPIVQ